MTKLQRDEDCFSDDSYSIRHEAAEALDAWERIAEERLQLCNQALAARDAAEAEIARLKEEQVKSERPTALARDIISYCLANDVLTHQGLAGLQKRLEIAINTDVAKVYAALLRAAEKRMDCEDQYSIQGKELDLLADVIVDYENDMLAEPAAQPPAVGEDVVGLAWRPIQDHVFPWEPHELIVACFYIGPESELKPEVQIFEAYCSKGNYFERSAGRSTGMTTLLEEGWTPFAWLDHATPPAIPSEDEMRAAKEHFRDYLGGEHDTGRANLLRTKDAG